MRKTIILYSAFLLVLIFSEVSLAQNEKKAFCAILIDNTSSLRSQFDSVKAFGKGVIEHIPQQGLVSLFNFTMQRNISDGVAVVTPGVLWTEDKASLISHINRLTIGPGRTVLFDGIYSIAENLNSKASLDKDTSVSKIIVVITDGEDRLSKIKGKQLIEKLRETGIKFFAIGLVSELDAERGSSNRSPKTKAVDFIKMAAKETGGRAVFPRSSKADISSLLNELFAGSGKK
jgi:Ca-activated chloride channel family protein